MGAVRDRDSSLSIAFWFSVNISAARFVFPAMITSIN
jgi:hypothetical protein